MGTYSHLGNRVPDSDLGIRSGWALVVVIMPVVDIGDYSPFLYFSFFLMQEFFCDDFSL